MKKIILILLSAAYFFGFSSKAAASSNYAANNEVAAGDNFAASSKVAASNKVVASDFGAATEEFSDAITDDARDFLNENEITPENNGAANLSFTDVLKNIWDTFAEKAAKPLKVLGALCGAILLCTLSNSISPDSTLKGVMPAVGALCAAGICAYAISGVLDEALGVLSASANFMLVFIPSFAAISAALGYTATASAVNTAVIAASQLLSQICVNLLAPLCCTILGFSTAGAVHPELKTEKVGEVVKKFTVWGLSLVMTIFMGVLSVQTAVVSASDTAAIKTAKFIVSQGVPIVGKTISDAVGTVEGGLRILKSSIGTYGIIAAGAVIVPMIVTLICYLLIFSAAEAAAEMFDLKPFSTLAKCCAQIMTIILAVCACFLLLNFISAAILLAN